MKKFGIFFTALASLAAAILLPTSALAASNALGVNPRKDYTIQPGQKVTDTIFVRNLSKTDTLNVGISLLDFKAQGDTGSPAFLLHETTPTRWSLKQYITVPKNVTIAPGQSSDVPITISMPTDAGPGSYYSAIRFDANGGGGSGNLSLSGSDMTLVFVRVPGQANDKMHLTHFGTFVPGATAGSGAYQSFFSASQPRYLSYELNNTGNVAEQPTGSILITNQFGKQVRVYQNVNPNNFMVLIDQTRRIDFCLNSQTQTAKAANGATSTVNKCNNPGLAPGHYTAKLDLFYGSDGSPSQELRSTATFWYLPVWFIIAVVVGVLVIIGILWLIMNALKNRGKNKYKTR